MKRDEQDDERAMTTEPAAASRSPQKMTDPPPDLLAGFAITQPDKIALVEDRLGEPVRTVTYGALNDAANQIANALLRRGVKANDHVAWLGRNSIEIITFIAGAGKAGCLPVPLNHRVLRAEAVNLLSAYDVVFVWASSDLVGVLDGIEGDTKVESVVVFNGPTPPGRQSSADFLDGVSNDQPPAPEDRFLSSMGGFTSGTTGKPKRIMRDPTKGTLAREREHIDRIWTTDPQVFITSGAVSSGAAGGYYGIALSHGDTIVLQAKFDPEDWMRLVAKYRVSVAYLSPAVCRQICALPPEVRAKYDISSIHAVFAGAAKWTYAVKLMYRETFPENTLWEIYGSTELASNTVMAPWDHWGRPGSCGKPVVGVEIVLRDPDDQIVTTPQVKGVLYVRSAYTVGFLGYENEPEATADAIWGDYRTVGDIAYFDEEGFYYICDRNKDMIVSGGVNLYPQEIEAVVDSHPGVLECAVFGIPDELWGEAVHAVVVARPGVEMQPSDVTNYCRQHLSSDKVPRSVEFVSELPHTLSGKVLKRALRDKYWANAGSMV